LSENDKSNFNENLKIINKQIKQIENLINEFSDFARMPKPILKKHKIVKIIKENILLKRKNKFIKLTVIPTDITNLQNN